MNLTAFLLSTLLSTSFALTLPHPQPDAIADPQLKPVIKSTAVAVAVAVVKPTTTTEPIKEKYPCRPLTKGRCHVNFGGTNNKSGLYCGYCLYNQNNINVPGARRPGMVGHFVSIRKRAPVAPMGPRKQCRDKYVAAKSAEPYDPNLCPL